MEIGESAPFINSSVFCNIDQCSSVLTSALSLSLPLINSISTGQQAPNDSKLILVVSIPFWIR